MLFVLLGLALAAMALGRWSAVPAPLLPPVPSETLTSGGPMFPVHPAFPTSIALGLIDRCMATDVMPTAELVAAGVRDAIALARPDVAQFLMAAFVTPAHVLAAKDANPPPFAPPPAPYPAQPPPAPTPSPRSAPTITVSGRSSPIEGVPNERWCELVDLLEREPVDYTTERHVGAYRQRKDRLAELGVTAVPGDKQSQYQALVAELSDALNHAKASGLVDRVNEFVDVNGQMLPVTLSGMLGVIQAAGLEGAVSWLDSADDRRKFRGTTAQFMRTNGVF